MGEEKRKIKLTELQKLQLENISLKAELKAAKSINKKLRLEQAACLIAQKDILDECEY